MRHRIQPYLIALGISLVAIPSAYAQSGSKPARKPASQSSAAKPASQSQSSGAKQVNPQHDRVWPAAEATKPLPKGEKIPAVEVRNANGNPVNLAELVRGKKTVLVFYRGGWCPYCNTHLADLARIQPQLAMNDIQIVAISPDSPETLAGYLEENRVPYALLSDNQHKAMTAFGIAFSVDKPTQDRLAGFGIDLVGASGNETQALPVPSLFLVGPDGTIGYAHSNPDYSKRLNGDQVLQAAGIKPASTGSAPKKEGSAAKEQGSGQKEASPGSAPKPERPSRATGSGSK